MKRSKLERKMNRSLLDSILKLEGEWKQIQYIIDNSIEPIEESQHRLQLAQAKYIFLLKEAKHREITYLNY